MKKMALVVALLSGLALAQNVEDPKHEHMAGEDMNSCPMHAAHRKDAHEHSAMRERGADEHGMGFSQEATTHNFRLTREGGVIEVTANDAKDEKSIAQVQMHLEHIAHAFAAGDFTIPHFVHDQDPPGVKVLQERKAELGYKFERMSNGGQLVITAKTKNTIKALHDFLRFQIKEHAKGNPLEAAAK